MTSQKKPDQNENTPEAIAIESTSFRTDATNTMVEVTMYDVKGKIRDVSLECRPVKPDSKSKLMEWEDAYPLATPKARKKLDQIRDNRRKACKLKKTGLKVTEAARLGGHERARQWLVHPDDIRDALAEYMRENPNVGRTESRKRIAKELRVHYKTVERHTKEMFTK